MNVLPDALLLLDARAFQCPFLHSSLASPPFGFLLKTKTNREDKSDRLPWEARAQRSNKQNHTSILPTPPLTKRNTKPKQLQRTIPSQNSSKPGMYQIVSQDAAHQCQPSSKDFLPCKFVANLLIPVSILYLFGLKCFSSK